MTCHGTCSYHSSRDQCRHRSPSSAVQVCVVILAQDARYISRLCYDVSVHLSVTEVHWVAVHAGNTAAAPASEVEAIIRSPTNMAAADGGVISHYASHW